MVTLRSIKLTWIICIIIGTGFITGIASAGIYLYGTTSNGDSAGSTSTLVRIDPLDGDLLDTIGSGVGYLVNGMAWDYQTQTLYASTSTNDPAFTGLIVIDRGTGAGTAVGTADWGQGAGFSISNITIDSNGNMVGWADATNQLVQIDKETGEITSFTGTSVTAVNFGLSYDNINLLYLVNGNVSGDESELWVFVDSTQDFTDGPSVEYESRQGDFYPYSNLYYGIDHTGTDTRSLVSIDVGDNTGNNYSDSFETVDQLHTLAFVVTSSKDSGGSSTCFISSVTNTD